MNATARYAFYAADMHLWNRLAKKKVVTLR